MAEQAKRAIQRIVTDDSGNIRIIYVDLETLQQIPEQNLGSYNVINANQQNIERVVDIAEPDPEPLNPTSIVDDTPRQSQVAAQNSNGSPSISPTTGTSQAVNPAGGGSTNLSPVGASSIAANQVGSSNVVSPTRTGSQQITPTRTAEVADRVPSGSATATQSRQITKGAGLANLTSTPEDGLAARDSAVGFMQSFGPNRPNMPNTDIIDNIKDSVGNVMGPGSTVVGTSGKGNYGSHRHRQGQALDFQVQDKQGKTVDNKVAMEDIAMDFAARNPTAGIGYNKGYMGPNTMHLDLANDPASWGAKNSRRGIDPNFANNLDFARRTGIGPTPTFGAPTPFGPDDKQSPATATGDTIDTSSLAGMSASAISKMDQAKTTNRGFTSVTGRPGVTTIDDGYTTVERAGPRSARNNNPGNLEMGPRAQRFGAIGDDGRFAVFDDKKQGLAAMTDLMFSANINKTIEDAITSYAPPNENNTKGYIGVVTQALGLPAETRLSDLSPAQRETMLGAMITHETGFAGVKETRNQHTYSGPPSTGNKDAPSETSGGKFGGKGLGGYTSKGGYDSPSEGNKSSRGGTTGGYSGKDASRDSPSEGGGRFGGGGLGTVDKGKSGAADKGTSSYGGAKSSGDAQSPGKSGGKSSGNKDKDKGGSGPGTGGIQGKGGRNTE